MRELTVGIGNSSVRAGLIKVAGGFHVLDAHAELVMRAAAEAHHATGAPIAIHHELGSAADAVLDLLVDELDVHPAAVILGHLNRFPDHRGHLDLAEAGCVAGVRRAVAGESRDRSPAAGLLGRAGRRRVRRPAAARRRHHVRPARVSHR